MIRLIGLVFAAIFALSCPALAGPGSSIGSAKGYVSSPRKNYLFVADYPTDIKTSAGRDEYEFRWSGYRVGITRLSAAPASCRGQGAKRVCPEPGAGRIDAVVAFGDGVAFMLDFRSSTLNDEELARAFAGFVEGFDEALSQ